MTEAHSMLTPDTKIGIVGLGVAGLTCAHLLDPYCKVTLFEKNDYLGGHTNTVVINDGPDQSQAVDTGFIVFNDRNYPHLLRLFERIGIHGQDSDMSFGFSRESDGFAYSSYVPRGLFADPRNILSLSFYRMIREIIRFNREGAKDLSEQRVGEVSLGKYLERGKYSQELRDHYLIPMGAAIWSTPLAEMLDYPAETFLRFFYNHGLLALQGRPRWQSVPGGSFSYVKAIKATLKGVTLLKTKIGEVKRQGEGVLVREVSGKEHCFDYVIIGAHANEAYAMLSNPTEDEKRLLGAWRYHDNDTILHTDTSVMPKNRRAWASWNYVLEDHKDSTKHVSLTYDMNRLQKLQTQKNYFVTLNRQKSILDQKIIKRIHYTHPSFTFDSVKTQKELPNLNENSKILFCGSYFRYGFHEDAVKSAVDLVRRFGVEF